MPGILTALTFGRAANGEPAYARSAPTYVDARALAANTNETHTVPAGADVVAFSADGAFFAKRNGAAAIPGGAITDGSASELNSESWNLDGVTTIGLIAPSARIVTLTFYKRKNH